MDFRTIIEPAKSLHSLTHKSGILMMGSCFTENIGEKLQNLKFQIDVNPFGALFNPISVAKGLERIFDGKPFEENELFNYNDCWHSFSHHSRFSMPNKTDCLKRINERFTYTSEKIKNTDCLILTFGTAFTFYKIEDNEPVSNCHKLPAKNFNRKLLDVESIVAVYKKLFENLKKSNSNLKIILTISPVRHLSNGAHENQISKSILLLAVNELCQLGYAEYFPAYEIVLDDLRDYRFYKPDMMHPSEEAVSYIFEKFSESYFTEETKQLNSEIESILNVCNHKPFNSKSESFKKFCQQTLEKISSLHKCSPYLDFTHEIKYLKHFV